MKNVAIFASVLTLATAAFAQPVAVDLGTLTSDTTVTAPLAAGEIVWYTFAIGDEDYFDINTNDSVLDPSSDTEIGLYDATGLLVATDDDDGIGTASTLTFNAGSGLELGDPFNLGGNGLAEGEDGPLGAGTYYLAVSGFNTEFGADNFDVTTTHTRSGTLEVDFYVPEPASLVVLALGAVVALRRR